MNIFVLSNHGLSAEYLTSIPMSTFNLYVRLYNKKKIAEDEVVEQNQDQKKHKNVDPILLNQVSQ